MEPAVALSPLLFFPLSLHFLSFLSSSASRCFFFLSAFLHDTDNDYDHDISFPVLAKKSCSPILKPPPSLVLRMLLHVFLIINVALFCVV